MYVVALIKTCQDTKEMLFRVQKNLWSLKHPTVSAMDGIHSTFTIQIGHIVKNQSHTTQSEDHMLRFFSETLHTNMEKRQ